MPSTDDAVARRRERLVAEMVADDRCPVNVNDIGVHYVPCGEAQPCPYHRSDLEG